ncbi:uncharacterized protein C4orf50 homolog [Rattus rattus]|uniref:uncharacterized protein C4orf50 homolog n=1 Tax=Rattus rattus TaxID=10117 RepID=UPI0013F33926|nr:uncharacterized protein C4orf50 homolog [Rattus rattus]
MEPTAQGQTEKSFSYVIRAPSIDGSDGINVDVKIDTCWVFRDVEERDKEQGCLPETVSSLDLDTGLLREQLESSEWKLLAAVDKHVISESGLRNRVRELELSERRLLLKVEQLRACVAQERSATLHTQEQLQALQGTLVSQVREAESAIRRQRWLQERLQRKDEALARQAAALKRCGRVQRQQLGLVREQERVLRVQVQRLERDVRRLGRAAGLLLAQLHAADSSPGTRSSGSQFLAGSLGDTEVVELSALRARAELAERERAKAVRRLREHSATERQLREQLEELRCCVYGLTLSEIGLHSQVEELAHQNRRLRAQLGHSSPGALGCAQSDSLPPLQAVVLDPCSSHSCHGDACGLQGLAGQLSEEPPSCVGDGPDHHRTVSTRTIGKLQRDLSGSEHRQVSQRGFRIAALVQPHPDPQAPRLLCGCPPGSGMDEPLCSLSLAGLSENLQTVGAQEALLLLPASMFQLWGPAGDPELLLPSLLHECPLQELQTLEELDSMSSPAHGALAHPGCHCNLARSHDTSLSQESSHISNDPFLTKGPEEPRDTQQGGRGPPVISAEKWGVMGTLGGIKSELDDRCLLLLQGSEKLSLDTEVHSLEGMQEGGRAADTQAVASFPWLHSECLTLPLRGTASRSQEGPDSLSKSGSVEGCGWECLVNLSPEKEEEAISFRAHETQESWTNGSQLPVGKGKEAWRHTQGKLGHQLCFGDTELLPKERSGDEEQEEMQIRVTSDPASVGPEQPEFKTRVGEEQRVLIDDQDVLQFPRLTSAGTNSEGPCSSQALITGQDRCALQTDTLEKEAEACFQRLNNPKLMCGDAQRTSALVRESQSATQRWRVIEEGACLQQSLASQDLNAKSNRNSEGVGLEEDVVLCNGDDLPGAALDGDKANWGPAELGGSQLPPTWCTLNRAGSRFHQLLANKKKERSQVLLENARLEGDQEGCCHEGCPCEKEHTGEVAKALRLEQANHVLQGELVRLRHELDQCMQAVSDLEECNRKSYCKISQLEEENEKLKGDLGQLHKAVSESVRKAGSRVKHVTQENTELRALISELGVSYKGLIKDTVLGIEDMVWALQGENEHLVGRVQGLEREVLKMSRDPEKEKWYSQGNSNMAEDEGHTEDKEVQVTMFSRQLSTRAGGPSWAEKSDVTGGPSLDLEGSRCRADASTTSSVCAVTTGPQEAHTNGAGGDGAWLQKEQKIPWCSVQEGQPQRSRSHSPQVFPPNSKVAASEEDTKLCIQRLHHQVRTLQCQLRDQGWALRELQAARDEATGLQDKLKSKLEELWEQQCEVRLASSPLKAKMASLVRKCQERNRLIEHLLQELPRHEPKNHLLSELAQNMLEDVALAEYSATFLTPGASEVSCHRQPHPCF